MKRRYDVPCGRKQWEVVEDVVYDFSPVSGHLKDARWERFIFKQTNCTVFTSHPKAAAYFVKQKLMTNNEVKLKEVTLQDFSMWRKK